MKKYTTDKHKRLLGIFNKVTKLDPKRDVHDKILVVDSLNLFIRSFCVVPTLNDNGIHVGGVQGSLVSLQYAIKKIRPTRIIMVWDGRGGSKARREMYDGYKANRGKGLKGLNRTVEWADEEAEEKAAVRQISRLAQYTEHLPVTSIVIDYAEADDVIAYICNQLFPDDKKIVMSTDKDFYQLVSDKTSIYRPTTKEIIDRKYLQENFAIAPHNFALYRALDGDPSDNLPGVKGVGLKTVAKLYPELADDTVYDPEYIIEKAEKNLDTKAYEKIFNNADIVRRNHKLMQLSETILSGDKISTILDILNNQKISLFNRAQLNKMLSEDKLYIQQRGMGGWYSVYSDADSRARVFNRQLTERK